MSSANNKTSNLYGLIGNPVSHSLSPLIHNYLFDKYSICSYYASFYVPTKKLSEAVSCIKELGISGGNITSPFKQEIMKYIDNIDEDALKIGAINTIINNNGRLYGYNTDYYGIIKTFEHNRIEIKSKRILLLGAGGVASTILNILCDLDAEEIIILNRTVEKARNLINNIKKRRINIKYGEINNQSIMRWIRNVDIVINATSAKLDKEYPLYLEPRNLKDDVVFFDVSYNSTFMKIIEDSSRYKFIDGTQMLIFQALESFKIWTGISPNISDYIKLLKTVKKC